MVFGDVLLLEAQEYDPVGGPYFRPVEIADGITTPSGLRPLGMVVVEAGCNGSYDLDALHEPKRQKDLRPESPDFRDCGAIMVGAGSSAARTRGWIFQSLETASTATPGAENVDTTSTNSAGNDNTAYTTGFNGTSSASPIVTGAALMIQGIAESSLGYRFSPR